MHGPHLPAPGHWTSPLLPCRVGWTHAALWDMAQELCLQVCSRWESRGPGMAVIQSVWSGWAGSKDSTVPSSRSAFEPSKVSGAGLGSCLV